MLLVMVSKTYNDVLCCTYFSLIVFVLALFVKITCKKK